MAFESIDVSGPEPPELGQPAIHLLKWLGFEPVKATLCIHGRLHETGVAQHSQVFGNSRLRHTKLSLDLPYRLLRRNQKAQDRATVRLGDDFEYGFHC